MGESFDGGHELYAAPVADDRVHLVENQRFDMRQRQTPLGGRQKQGETLGRGDQNVRRFSQHALPIALGGIAGPCLHADARKVMVGFEVAQRGEQVALNVVVQGFQG